MRYWNNKAFYITILSLGLLACSGGDYVPKPKGFNHIALPAHAYHPYTPEECPFSFEVSKVAEVKQDTISRNKSNNCYKLITYPQFDCYVYLTYKPIGGDQQKLAELIDQSLDLSYKHDVKAQAITPEQNLKTAQGYPGYTIRMEGEVPSQYQFFTHDSSNHFLRGALYFQTATKNDSLRPVIEYISEDIDHLVKTLKWE
jgi:gliding motility-associated lipoprotein GldD